ncbi:NAD(P)H-dependent oxidoreductase [Enterococcus saccharolyticus]|uniref:NAD(P)H-dependent oxidoreductase n=1 Tax=Enterococcus saccharolyticus TaxID=41997 RepID=UPI001E5395BE|nr:NAD(P)H-dependent oxidoreductase [Enterococcus saccharolyticus]MCD5002637.1 NAD(P)H-dependent oxidoreductase [Enterococcus saccharolyticus]
MKTLIIISHPDIQDSSSQRFLQESLPQSVDITVHHLEAVYPDGKIDIQREQQLLREHDRIIFQFPFYWYSSPAMLKHWQDEVLAENFAYGARGRSLQGKELGLVLVIGVGEKEYQVGGTEGFSISTLTTPYQALANKLQMTFLKPFPIFQFQYMTEHEKMTLLLSYQQYVTMQNYDSLREKEKWYLQQLAKLKIEVDSDHTLLVIDQMEEVIEDHRMELDEIQMYIDGEVI